MACHGLVRNRLQLSLLLRQGFCFYGHSGCQLLSKKQYMTKLTIARHFHNVFGKRYFHKSETCNLSSEDDKKEDIPSAAGHYRNPLTVLKNEFRCLKEGKEPGSEILVPRETDILVIGAGATGMAVAHWAKTKTLGGVNVTVVEKDYCYKQCASTASVGGLRQQFSLKENVQMSLFGAEFMRNFKDYLGVPGYDPPDCQFCPQGYLFLATKNGSRDMEKNHKMLVDLKADVELMGLNTLSTAYPWLNTSDIAMGSLGLQNEGHFDPWLFLAAFRAKCEHQNVKFVKGEVVDFEHKDFKGLDFEKQVRWKKEIEHVLVKAEDGRVYPIKAAAIVNCAGPWLGDVGYKAGIGRFKAELSAPIPVEPRKRFVYVLHCPNGPGLEMPMLIDPSGFYIRPEGIGNYYICGKSPEIHQEPDHTDLEVDNEFFHEHIWPQLANRLPAFNELKVTNAWAGYYDYNYFDENLIVGNHPYFKNFIIAGGSSGHGIQHAPAIGRAISELLFDDGYKTIDLSLFSFDRVIYDEKIQEQHIV